MCLKILIGADLVPTKSNYEAFRNSDIEYLIGDGLIDILNENHVRIFNLETPLAEVGSPINKCGPNLLTPPETIKAIKKMDPSLLTLANNHIMDQGPCGLESTLKILEEYEIPYSGVGRNSVEAAIPYSFDIKGKKVGIYACAENEFSISTKQAEGANAFDSIESFDHIESLKRECDFVIVLYHGGNEFYRYPSPYLQKRCRKMAGKGADLIVCQHSHCIGCFEKYLNSTIVYGQGNFIFDHADNEFSSASLMIRAQIFDESYKIDYTPIMKRGNKVELADKNEADEVLAAFNKRSEQILQEDFVENEYRAFAKSKETIYLNALCGDHIILKVLNKIFRNQLSKKMYSKAALTRILNYIECEAHRELIITLLKNNNNQ